MKKYNCPSCAAEVLFLSNLSVYAVCKYCNSMIVRRDVDVESIGTMAALPDDMSPLQIGTGGFYNGLRFTIIGRLKIGWDSGVWNEWFLYIDDGRRGWLSEAQGCYAVSFELDYGLQPNIEATLNKIIVGFEEYNIKTSINEAISKKNYYSMLNSYIILNNQKFKVVDIKRSTYIGSEGELPFTAPKGREILSIDLSSENGEFACIEILNGNKRIYIGHYLEWNDMRCDNIRTLEGW